MTRRARGAMWTDKEEAAEKMALRDCGIDAKTWEEKMTDEDRKQPTILD
jgi:hypothetical protein